MDRYNRRKVYLCTGLVQRFPGTTFTQVEGEEEARRSETRGREWTEEEARGEETRGE